MSTVSRKKSSFLSEKLTTPPEGVQHSALHQQAESKREEAKTVVVVKTPTMHATSVLFAKILSEKIGGVKATTQENVVSVTTSARAVMSNAKIIIIPIAVVDIMRNANATFHAIESGIDKTRSLIEFVCESSVLQTLVNGIVATAKHASAQRFPLVVEKHEDVLIWTPNADATNKLEARYVNQFTREEAKTLRVGRIGKFVINGIDFDLIVKDAFSVYPERFDSDGKYIAKRAKKDDAGNKKESATNKERDVYIVRIAYGSEVKVFASFGIDNLNHKINAKQDIAVRALTSDEDNAKIEIPKNADADAEDAEDADDADADDADE